MSTYEVYDGAVASSYDRTRVPVGVEIILGYLAGLRKPLAQVEVLDAGCGTGIYAAPLAARVGRLVALDVSCAMLAQAQQRLARAIDTGRAAFAVGSMRALPFAADSVDAVLFSQVLHHLEDGTDPAFEAHLEAIAGAHRILRPGGLLVVSTCTHDQLRHVFWYYDLIPSARDACMARYLPAERLEKALDEQGFALPGRTVPLDAVMQGARYFDARGPLDAAWGRTDSIWAMASPAELADAERRIEELDEEGRLDGWMQERDARRRTYGQFTFFVAEKRR